jgi:hypothetical protein
VARRLQHTDDVPAAEREADLVCALEHSRSETVLWRAKEEMARARHCFFFLKKFFMIIFLKKNSNILESSRYTAFL